MIFDRRKYAIARLKTLAEFLRNPKGPHAAIEWSVCGFWQKNTYIVGDRAYYEGSKKDASGGYDFTLRQSTPASIRINSLLFDALFRHLESETLKVFERVGGSRQKAFPNIDPRIDALRRSTLAQIEESLSRIQQMPRSARKSRRRP